MTSTTDTSRHPDVSEISDLTEGLLPPSRTADVREHLDGCPLCADVRASLEEIRGLLGTLPGAHRMPADVAGRIDAALAAEALLNSTAPDETPHVSRETATASQSAETTSADRPSGHARASTGPGRSRQGRRRRKAVLGAVFGAAAVGMSVLLLQSLQSTGVNDADAKKDASVSSAAGASQEFSAADLKGHVQALLTEAPGSAEPRLEKKGPSTESQSKTFSPKQKPAVSVPPCVQKGTGRTDAPIAAEQGEYKGDDAYLVVLPHSTDSQRVQAYVIDATCVDKAPASAGKLLLTNSYPLH
ncbi:zf-HC2 domain-containing protein [Streptomyces sp. NPDC005408]|uniref:anti-sigma factor family protein n=1 Tax=Streptomyces sp. NPDC005408 TaxID=3155341 RepID=UPI0033A3DE94